MQANWPAIVLYLGGCAALVWWCHSHGLTLARRLYYRWHGMCACGRDDANCSCPGVEMEDVFTFTPWDDLTDDERADAE